MRQFASILLAVMFGTVATLAQSASSTNPTPSASPAVSQPGSAEQQTVEQNLKDVHFAFDKYDLTPEDHRILQQDAAWLKGNPNVTVSIAGDADERGEIVYNVDLSQKRAQVTRDALVALGVAPDRIEFATGWGKLYPVCNQSDESCWSQNRRAHFTAGTMLQNQIAAQSGMTSATLARK